MSSLKIVADALRAEALSWSQGEIRSLLLRVAARLEAEDRRIEGLRRFPDPEEEREPDEVHTLGDPAEETLDRPGNWRDDGMRGEWRCPLCDEPIEDPGQRHDSCPSDLMPSAYWRPIPT